MRPRKLSELLQVMLENFDLFFMTGLCFLNSKLNTYNVITKEKNENNLFMGNRRRMESL